jgi:hypothetical protein
VIRRLLFIPVVLGVALAGSSALAGTTGPLTGNPDPIPFGSVQVGSSSSPVQMTITNTDSASHTIDLVQTGGADPGQFSVSNNCNGVTLDPNGGANYQCTVDVTFSPTALGSYTSEVDVSYDGGNQAGDVSNLSGTGDTTSVNVTPLSIDFGTQKISDPASSQNVTVTNNGSTSVTVVTSSITAGSSDFSDDGGCDGAVLANNGDHCTITVTFSPQTAGNKSGTLQIQDTGVSSPETVSLSGTATAPSVQAPNLDFGDVLLGKSASKVLTVTNNGSAPLDIASNGLTVSAGASNYSLSADHCSGQTLTAGNSCSATVNFHPVLSGAHPGDISISDNAPGSPQDVKLAGNGLSKFVNITPTSHDYGSMTVGRLGTSHTFTLKNLNSSSLTIGAAPLTLVGANPGSFAITADHCQSQTIAPSHTCTFTVRFTPGAGGALSVQLREADSASDSPHTVSLTGTGVRPANVTRFRGWAGCTRTTVRWTPSSQTGRLGTTVWRNSHVPRYPGDGRQMSYAGRGLVLDRGLAHFHRYYYAIWTEYRFTKNGPIIYSPRSYTPLRTGESCYPQSNGVITTTRPNIRWLSVPHAFAYGLRIFQHGTGIFSWAKRTTRTSYQLSSSWTYRHKTHRLQRGGSYEMFVYAYTRAHPSGIAVGRPIPFSVY